MLVTKDPSNAIEMKLKNLPTNNIEFFNVKVQEGLLRTLMIRTASTGDLMVILQFYQMMLPKENYYLTILLKPFQK